MEEIKMDFNAYSKRQFAQSDFDASGYRFATENEVGDSYARLDCKRWGKGNLIAYLTLDDGEKIIVVAWPSQKYCGLKEIPFGTIIDVSFDMEMDSKKVFLCRVAWYEEGSEDQKEAEECFSKELNEKTGGNTGTTLS